jgi:hypothetical protein
MYKIDIYIHSGKSYKIDINNYVSKLFYLSNMILII